MALASIGCFVSITPVRFPHHFIQVISGIRIVIADLCGTVVYHQVVEVGMIIEAFVLHSRYGLLEKKAAGRFPDCCSMSARLHRILS